MHRWILAIVAIHTARIDRVDTCVRAAVTAVVGALGVVVDGVTGTVANAIHMAVADERVDARR